MTMGQTFFTFKSRVKLQTLVVGWCYHKCYRAFYSHTTLSCNQPRQHTDCIRLEREVGRVSDVSGGFSAFTQAVARFAPGADWLGVNG